MRQFTKSAMPVFAAFLGGVVGSFILFGVLQTPSYAGVEPSPFKFDVQRRIEALEILAHPPDTVNVLTRDVSALTERVEELEGRVIGTDSAG